MYLKLVIPSSVAPKSYTMLQHPRGSISSCTFMLCCMYKQKIPCSQFWIKPFYETPVCYFSVFLPTLFFEGSKSKSLYLITCQSTTCFKNITAESLLQTFQLSHQHKGVLQTQPTDHAESDIDTADAQKSYNHLKLCINVQTIFTFQSRNSIKEVQ